FLLRDSLQQRVTVPVIARGAASVPRRRLHKGKCPDIAADRNLQFQRTELRESHCIEKSPARSREERSSSRTKPSNVDILVTYSRPSNTLGSPTNASRGRCVIVIRGGLITSSRGSSHAKRQPDHSK